MGRYECMQIRFAPGLVLILLCWTACGAEEPANKPTGEQALKLQVWLDRQNFGPGKIDGKGGEFTSKAAALYREANPDAPKDDAGLAGKWTEPATIDYTVQDKDLSLVGELPTDKEAQSKLKTLPYPDLAQALAEKFHADKDYIVELNPGKDVNAFKAGDAIKVPNVEPLEVAALREGKLPTKAEFAKRIIEVDTKEKMLKLIEEGKVLAAFPVTPGSDKLPAPLGEWTAERIVTMPPYLWDESMLKEGKRSENTLELPPGPRCPVGVLWIGLNKKGVGIHGTDSPDTIGRSVSHGCVRLANWDAIKLSGMITEKIKVVIK